MSTTPRFEVYRVARPFEMLGLPSRYRWAVARDGSFEEAFTTKRAALAYIAERTKKSE